MKPKCFKLPSLNILWIYTNGPLLRAKTSSASEVLEHIPGQSLGALVLQWKGNSLNIRPNVSIPSEVARSDGGRNLQNVSLFR